MELELRVSKRVVIRTFIAMVVFLHAANLFTIWIRFTPVSFPLDDTFVALLGVSSEAKTPTWYSAACLLLCSLLLLLIAQSKRRSEDAFRRYWLLLAILFAFLSLDEATSVHETATRPIRAALDTKGPFYYAWVKPGMAFVVLFAVAYCAFSCNCRRG